MKLSIATIYTEDIKELAVITVEYNKRKYCEKHGYDLNVKTNNFQCSDFGFAKIAFVLDLLKSGKYSWVFWCGSDTMITNYGIKLEDLIDDNYHFIIANDVWDLNADSFLIKNSPEAISFFEKVYSLYDKYIDKNGKPIDDGSRLPDGGTKAWAEQKAIIDLKSEYEKIIKVVPQKTLNSYCYWIYPSKWHQAGKDCLGNDGSWSSGDFLVHWPGLPNNVRVNLALNFIKQVKNE